MVPERREMGPFGIVTLISRSDKIGLEFILALGLRLSPGRLILMMPGACPEPEGGREQMPLHPIDRKQ